MSEKQKKRILIVDDKVEDIQVLGQLLRKKGYLVSFSQSGPQALSVLKHETPDCVILDVGMPGMDGFELCRKIRKTGKTEHIPIIFATGRKDTDSVVRGFASGANDYVVKPYIYEEIYSRIKNAIELYVLHSKMGEMVEQKTRELSKANAELKEEVKVRREKEAHLAAARDDLETKNITLQEVLRQIEAEKAKIADEAGAKIDRVILPQLKKLETEYGEQHRPRFAVIEKELAELFANQDIALRRALNRLPPRAAEVCALIKSGQNIKEIAKLLHITEDAVKFHRKKIRKELGISNEKVNICVYLNSFK